MKLLWQDGHAPVPSPNNNTPYKMIPARGPQTKFSYIFCWYLLKPHVFCCSLGGRACQQVLHARSMDGVHYRSICSKQDACTLFPCLLLFCYCSCSCCCCCSTITLIELECFVSESKFMSSWYVISSYVISVW